MYIIYQNTYSHSSLYFKVDNKWLTYLSSFGLAYDIAFVLSLIPDVVGSVTTPNNTNNVITVLTISDELSGNFKPNCWNNNRTVPIIATKVVLFCNLSFQLIILYLSFCSIHSFTYQCNISFPNKYVDCRSKSTVRY